MKQKSIYFVLAVLLLTIGCTIFKPNETENLGLEEHAIISAVLDSIIHQHPLGTIDVYDMTSTFINTSSLLIAFERDSIGSDSLLARYSNINQIRYALNGDKLPEYVMLKDSDEAEPFSGYTAFTRPAISHDGLIAVVEYSSASAPLAGCGMAALLEKENELWQIVSLKMIWIS